MQNASPNPSQSLKPTGAKLLDQVRDQIRYLHYSYKTEKAYLGHIERFLGFHRHRAGVWVHPLEMSPTHLAQYLTHLACERKVAASTQNVALSAVLFPFQKVLEVEVGWLKFTRPNDPRTCRFACWWLVEVRHPHRAGTTRSSRRQYDHDLRPRLAERCLRSAESTRPSPMIDCLYNI